MRLLAAFLLCFCLLFASSSVIGPDIGGGAASGANGREVLLDSTTVSAGVANVDLDCGGSCANTYDYWRLEIYGLTVTVDDSWVAVRSKVGGSFQAGNTYHNTLQSNNAGAAGQANYANTTDTGVLLTLVTTDAVGNAAAESFGPAFIVIPEPDNTTTPKVFNWTSSHINQLAELTYSAGSGGYVAGTGALTGVQVIPESGNIDGGTFKLFGIQDP